MLKADVSGSLEAFEDEIAKLPQDEVTGQRHPLRRRRHHRVRRQPRRRVRRGHPRLQRPPGRRGAPAGRPRGRRDPHLLGHLPRDRRAARRHAGHARARGGRGGRRHASRSAQIFRASQDRHDRRLLRHRRARSRAAPRCRLVRDGTVVYDGEIALAAALQRRRARGRRPASSAASCSRTSRTSRKATCSRSTRPGRSSARSPSACGRVRLRRRSCSVHLHFPDAGSPEGASARSSNRVKAHLRERLGAAVAEVDHQDTWQRSTLAVALAGGSPGRCEERRRRRRALPRRALPAGRARRAAAGLVGRLGVTRMSGGRMRRVDEAVREVLSGAITQELKDPRVGLRHRDRRRDITRPAPRARLRLRARGRAGARAHARRRCAPRTASCSGGSPTS